MLMRLNGYDEAAQAAIDERNAISRAQDERYQADFERRQQEQNLRLQQEAFDLNKQRALTQDASRYYGASKPSASKSITYSSSQRELPAVEFNSSGGVAGDNVTSDAGTLGGKVILLAGVAFALVLVIGGRK